MDSVGRSPLDGLLLLLVGGIDLPFSGELLGDSRPNAQDMRYGLLESWREGKEGREGMLAVGTPSLARLFSRVVRPLSAGDSDGECTSGPSPTAPASSADDLEPPTPAGGMDAFGSFRPNKPPSVARRVLRFGVGAGDGALRPRSRSPSFAFPFPLACVMLLPLDDSCESRVRSSADLRLLCSTELRGELAASRVADEPGAGAKSQ